MKNLTQLKIMNFNTFLTESLKPLTYSGGNVEKMQEALGSFWAEHSFMQDFMRSLCP